MKFNIKEKSLSVDSGIMSFSTGKIARQSMASVIVKHGKTTVLCTANVGAEMSDSYFLPLTVQYVEKFYANGTIPGGFLKREGRPSESEILISRLIDRSLRPIFAEGFNKEIQVNCTVLSYDEDLGAAMASCAGASAACLVAGLPLQVTMSGCQAFRDSEGNYKVGLSPDGELEVFISGTKDSVLMVEAAASEASEEEMLNIIDFASGQIKEISKTIQEFAEECNPESVDFETQDQSELGSFVLGYKDKIIDTYLENKEKTARTKALKKLQSEICELAEKEFEGKDYTVNFINEVIGQIEKKVMREYMLSNEARIDGRAFNEIREIDIDNNILENTPVHGASLFTRGETQSLSVTTLGSDQDVQYLDAVSEKEKSRFMLHYNFPAFSVGEAGMLRAPGRREIGHGRLAKKALSYVMPSEDEFPYVIRIVSEIMESNGSSSMATVCGASLSMLATGVPIKNPVAGIAMGLLKNKSKSLIITDIMGDEDHLGDMDFKVAGTKNGITALQMDMKITGIDRTILSDSLEQANEARMKLLEIMNASISSPNELGASVPKTVTMQIPKKKIADVIGKGGAVIKGMIEEFDCKIDVNDDGLIKIFAQDTQAVEGVKARIDFLTSDPVVGNVYEVKVVKIMDFGAFADLPGGKSGLIHVSEINDERVEDVSDFLKVGDIVKVKLCKIDDKGRYKLSIKQAK